MVRFSDRAIDIVNTLNTERLDYESEYSPMIDALNQCAAYEDLNLEPEEIKAKLRLLTRYQELGTVDELDQALFDATL